MKSETNLLQEIADTLSFMSTGLMFINVGVWTLAALVIFN